MKKVLSKKTILKVTPEVTKKTVQSNKQLFVLNENRVKLFGFIAHNKQFTFAKLMKDMKMTEGSMRSITKKLISEKMIGIKKIDAVTKFKDGKRKREINVYFITALGYKFLTKLNLDLTKILN